MCLVDLQALAAFHRDAAITEADPAGVHSAIDLPDTERSRLLDWLTSARLESTELRLTPSDQWHLTLAFYGEAPAQVLPELTERLVRAAQRSSQLSVQLGGVGSFPADPARARVLWMGVDGDLPGLEALRHAPNVR